MEVILLTLQQNAANDVPAFAVFGSVNVLACIFFLVPHAGPANTQQAGGFRLVAGQLSLLPLEMK
jgi:hypothetical protein